MRTTTTNTRGTSARLFRAARRYYSVPRALVETVRAMRLHCPIRHPSAL